MSTKPLALVLSIGFYLAHSQCAVAQTPAEIKLVQENLFAYGVGLADGKMGNKTRAAIKAYQRDWQIADTGNISKELIAMLKGVHSRTKPQWVKLFERNCRVWNTHPEPREQITWSGECRRGRADGFGKLIFIYIENGTIKRDTYHGDIRFGFQHGRGVYKTAGGETYSGQWQNGWRQGRGTFTGPNGEKYDGEWHQDTQHGRGLWIGPNGARYDGEWRHGRPHGRGLFLTTNGNREVRHWTNGCSRLNGRQRWLFTTEQACGFRQSTP